MTELAENPIDPEIVSDSTQGRPTTRFYYDPDKSDWEELALDDEPVINCEEAKMERALEMLAQVLLQQQRSTDNTRRFRVNQEDEDIQDYLTLFERHMTVDRKNGYVS